MYVCLYREQATRKENRKLCVTVPHKKMLACTTVTVLEYLICGMHTW